MNRITKVTRRDIFDILSNGIDVENYITSTHYRYDYCGRLSIIEFLNRLYPLKSMPSKDPRYENAEKDIYIHTVVNPNDYDEDWLFHDDRFSLMQGSDEVILNFICEVFHPEVRDEKGEWKMFLNHINNLLRADNYEIYPKDHISGRDVYGWRDLLSKRFYSLKETDIIAFLQLFNRGGYVLNFSTAAFDDFTKHTVGVALCSRYNLSKGKSLEQYTRDAEETEIIKLFSALMDYYESQPIYIDEINGNNSFSAIYKKCKSILSSFPKDSYLTNQAESLKEKVSSQYLASVIDLMYRMQKDNPTEAIGKAKELIESCCETILEKNNIVPDNNWKLNNLVDETMKLLEITPKHIPDTTKESAAIKAILGNLKGIASNIAIIRNAYGSGHGKSSSYKGLQERHAKLAIGSSITLVVFLWDSFERKIK